MIKYININEINNLKINFKDLIEIKKLYSNKNINKFFDGDLLLEEAIDVFIKLSSKKIIGIENISYSFINILKKYNILDNKAWESFDKCSFDYERDYSDDEYDEKLESYDDIESIKEKIETIINSICNISNIKFGKASFTDILFNLDNIDCEFSILNEANKDIFEEYYKLDDPIEEFFNNYSEDATIYYFKDYSIPSKIITLFNERVVVNGYGGMATEMFSMEDRYFITISDGLFNEPINIKLLLFIICALLGGRK